MKRRRLSILLTGLFMLVLFSIAHTDSSVTVKKDDPPFPSYGNGKVIVRLYTDYFCPPCRAMEQQLEPVIEDLIKRNIINLTFVDTPIYKHSSMYAGYFLYALNSKNDFDHAILVRNTLFDAAAGKVTEKERLEESLKGNGILFKPFEAASVFAKLNVYLKDDKVNSTPTCVIVQDGKTEKHVGGPDILKALKGLK